MAVNHLTFKYIAVAFTIASFLLVSSAQVLAATPQADNAGPLTPASSLAAQIAELDAHDPSPSVVRLLDPSAVVSPAGASMPASCEDGSPPAIDLPAKSTRRRLVPIALANSNTIEAGPPERRAPPAPLDPVFCMTDYIGAAGTIPIGVPDTDPAWPLQRVIWKACPLLKKYRIKNYGWVNPGYGYSTSRNSNFPLSYYLPARRFELDQLVFRTERIPDTVQTEHVDWGFRLSQLYGIDYRFTTAQGWYPASRELLQHNYLYGFDLVECYGLLYVPRVAQGMVLKFGRYISPPDIEAQLAPDNFLWTHSQMFTVDWS